MDDSLPKYCRNQEKFFLSVYNLTSADDSTGFSRNSKYLLKTQIENMNLNDRLHSIMGTSFLNDDVDIRKIYVLCIHNGRVRGIRCDLSLAKTPTHIQIRSIHIPRYFRNKGLGTEIFKALRSFTHSLGMKVLLWNVHTKPGNQWALSLIRKKLIKTVRSNKCTPIRDYESL